MNPDGRPNPDKLLQAIRQTEDVNHKGSLKIFFGMAAGVGKTYAMLEAAQKLFHSGVNVIVGVVDTHGREETAALLKGLPIVPYKEIEYKGTVFREMNLEEILKIKPQIVLVDELAHSNIPGSPHAKRWQDVVEILNNGIDVYSTLNVQHVESLKDFIENITSISIRETVPDSIIEGATFIELIDITPVELLERLKQGKVYLGDKSEIAARNFFQEDRLTALREIVLRYAAEKIDHDLYSMVSTAGRAIGWKHREKLLVGIDHTSHAQRLLRSTRRIAFNLNAPWIALYVNDGRALMPPEHSNLVKNLSMARDLGAEVITIDSPFIASTISLVARQNGVTQIVIGQTPSSSLFSYLFRNSIISQIARESKDIDIHIIRKSLSDYKTEGFTEKLSAFSAKFVWPYAAIFAITLLYFLLSLHKGPQSFLFLLAIIIALLYIGRMKKIQTILFKRETNIEILYELAKEIAASSPSGIFSEPVKAKLESLLNGECELITKIEGDIPNFTEAPALAADEKEKAVAFWVLQHGKEAGWSTSTLPGSQHLFLPLKGYGEVIGILTYSPKDSSKRESQGLTLEERNFLYAAGQLLTNSLERNFTEERARKLEDSAKTEKVYQSILSLLSKQLQTPLETIKSNLVQLEALSTPQNPTVDNHLKQIEECSESLIRIIENISAMARLSASLAPLNKSPAHVKDLINACCESLSKFIGTRKIQLHIQDGLPTILFDFSLIQILLCNLIVNAIENSPPNSLIEIEAVQNGATIDISIADQGPGIPKEMMEFVFDKFYKLPGATSSGVGLGLSIAKTIAEIHTGSLTVKNRISGDGVHQGTIFTLSLPV